jgi:hypothetical protein
MLLTLPEMSVPETNWNWNPDEVVGICNVDDIEAIINSHKTPLSLDGESQDV